MDVDGVDKGLAVHTQNGCGIIKYSPAVIDPDDKYCLSCQNLIECIPL